MKEATSELNMAVIVVIIVAGLIAFFFGFLWPMISEGFNTKIKCDEAICVCENKDANGNCSNVHDGKIECSVKGHPEQKITCTWKG